MDRATTPHIYSINTQIITLHHYIDIHDVVNFGWGDGQGVERGICTGCWKYFVQRSRQRLRRCAHCRQVDEKFAYENSKMCTNEKK